MNWSMLITVSAIAFVAFAVVMSAMAIGVMLGRRQISGSCGGLANSTDKDGNSSCSLCSNPAAACRDLSQRMRGECATNSAPEAADGPCEKDCQEEGCSNEQMAACKGSPKATLAALPGTRS